MYKNWALYSVSAFLIIAIILIVFLVTHPEKPKPVITNPLTIELESSLWQSYLKHQWLSEGRTVSNPINSITTSEAQSYTMLRAVWENDQEVFKTTWEWTRHNLQRPDKLFSWEWGKNPNGHYGIMTANNGQNTASDADSDIALALLMASALWHDPSYKADAISIIKSIWQIEVVKINNFYYLAADNVEKTALTPYIVVNPSYYAPYSYRIFARVDPDNPWLDLANDSYQEIKAMSQAKLNTNFSVNIPPDWVIVNRKTGALAASPNTSLTTNFGYNALRTIWRFALDWQWYHTDQAKNTLQQFSFLDQQWTKKHSLSAIYSHNGHALADYSSYALYGGTLAYFQYIHPKLATSIINQEIVSPLLDQKTGQLKKPINYYDNNWLWFGLALYNHQLPNLAKGIKP